MIKTCRVIINNEAVTVVDYDGTSVQFPTIKSDIKTVDVDFRDGKYFIVNNTKPQTEVSKLKGKKTRKTTIDETAAINEIATESEHQDK